MQDELVQALASGSGGEAVLACEHNPVLTLGKRTAAGELVQSDPYWNAISAQAVEVDRGGKATFHGPGQLMLYPVISLRTRRIGVRTFVQTGLEVIAEILRSYGVKAEARECPAGVFVAASPELSGSHSSGPDCSGLDYSDPDCSEPGCGGAERSASGRKVGERKIGFAGLRIQNGISNHGFSVNVSVDLEPFRHFKSCGLDTPVTSLQAEGIQASLEQVAERFGAEFGRKLTSAG